MQLFGFILLMYTSLVSSQGNITIAGTSLDCIINTHQQAIKSLMENMQNITSKYQVFESSLTEDRQRDKLEELSKQLKDIQHKLASVSEENEQLRGNLTSLQKEQSKTIGVNYIRWGRTVCPNDTNLVYTGFVGNSAYNQYGGGSSYVCLAGEPEWPENVHPGLDTGSHIYGTHYWAVQMDTILPHEDIFNDVPCAVCENPTHAQQLMIPGGRTCPEGWYKEFEGYLMSERTASHHVSHADYICVDKDYEYRPNGESAKLGAHVIPVEAVCGTLPCPPYEQGKELACVVCTK